MTITEYANNNTMSKKFTEQLGRKFNVKTVVYNDYISKGRKAEFFLLGAMFSQEDVEGVTFSIMVYQDTLYILSVGEEEQVYFNRAG